jgi:cell wall assembly regulator SMI1
MTKVPKPPEDVLPAGAELAECNAFEARTGISLPDDFRSWLKLSNGPCIGPGGLFGIRPARTALDIESRLANFPTWKTRKWLPVAGDGCGNYYVIPTQHEFGVGYPVVFIEPITTADAPQYIVASSIGRFLIFLLEEELGAKGWPFTETKVLEADPDIVRFVGVDLPWATT